MTPEDFKRLQKAQLEIMDEIHRLCVENKIEYYMIAGTLLGAVRHYSVGFGYGYCNEAN